MSGLPCIVTTFQSFQKFQLFQWFKAGRQSQFIFAAQRRQKQMALRLFDRHLLNRSSLSSQAWNNWNNDCSNLKLLERYFFRSDVERLEHLERLECILYLV